MQRQPNNQSNVIFLKHFFNTMLTKNPITFKLLTPKPIKTEGQRRRSKDKQTLLLRIIDYILTIYDCSMNTKHSLRAMGRSHLRVGIGREHMVAFKDAFLDAFYTMNKDNWFISRETNAWNILLSFVVEQMCFEKINFMSNLGILSLTDKEREKECEEECEKECEERSQLSLSLHKSSHKSSLNSQNYNNNELSRVYIIPSILEMINSNTQFTLEPNIPDTIEETSENVSGSLVPLIVCQQPEV